MYNVNLVGANSLEQYEYEGHDVEFRIVLMEVNNESKILENNITIIKVTNFQRDDINDFMDQFIKYVVHDWNQ
jgi:hypothetical protein